MVVLPVAGVSIIPLVCRKQVSSSKPGSSGADPVRMPANGPCPECRALSAFLSKLVGYYGQGDTTIVFHDRSIRNHHGYSWPECLVE